MNNIKNILVIHCYGGLGDLLLSTPVFHSLRSAFPQSRITALIQKGFSSIIEGNPAINEIIGLSSDDMKGIGNILKQIEIIRKKKFDLGIVLWSTAREAHLMFLSGIPVRVGQAGRLLYSFLFTHQVTRRSDQGDEESHWVENQLDFVRVLGIEPRQDDKKIFIDIPSHSQTKADLLLKELGVKDNEFLLGFHSTKGLPVDGKRWPLPHFALFADALSKELGGKIVLTGSSSEADLVSEIQKMMKYPSISVAGRTNIRELGGIIKRCSLFVCPDSGPMHIASALKVPVVGIYGLKEDFPQRWAPYDCPHEILRLPEIPCERKCVKADCPRFICYEAIPPEMVVSSAKKLLDRVRGEKTK